MSNFIEPGRMVILRGDLGAGKTTLVKGIAEGFNAALQEDVTSPTFTLVHEYRGPEITLFHIDLYRIDTERDLMTVGIDDLRAEPNSILLVVFANDQRIEGLDARSAALSAGDTRIRPVIMTATAMIIGMLPMALGFGEGGEQNAPLGRAVIGGLLLATVTTLFVVPMVYSLLRKTPPVDFERRIIEEEHEFLREEMNGEFDMLPKFSALVDVSTSSPNRNEKRSMKFM